MTDTAKAFQQFEQDGWERQSVCDAYDDHFSKVAAGAVTPLLDHAKVGPGKRVLDVATGAGYVAGAAAERGAEVTGVDFSSTQIEMARQRYPAATFEQCGADGLPFPDGSFDAVVNNYGIGHFPEPEAAIAEAFRILRSGGRFAIGVPDTPDMALAFAAVYGAVQAHGTMDVGLPPGPNYFLFSDPEQCERSLSGAGFQAISVIHVPHTWRMPSADAVIETMLQGTVRAAALLNGQTPKAKEAILEAIRESLRQFDVGGVLEIPMPSVVATGSKP